jgi:2-C-methyl-D-erythritol 2,4-cyclodiphosphate synthase
VPEIRSGLGFDVHPRDQTRPLSLAGIPFPGEPGLAGHSDGDAVCHAIADALLGAAALGDVGEHFPDDAPATEGIPGLDLLEGAVGLLAGAGFAPISLDVTVVADRPTITPAKERMRAAIATTLGIDVSRVSVKASRPEGLGLNGDGVGCLAIALVERT